MRSLRRIAVLAAALAPALVPGSASAHLGHVVTRAERYLKVEATADEARIAVTLVLGRRQAARALRAADADGDGTIDRGEADGYLAQRSEGLREELPIFIDGERVDPDWGDGYLDPLGRIRSVPLTVEMVAHVPLTGGEHRITVRDGMAVRDYDRTDVAFRVREGVRLLASGIGGSPKEPVQELAYGPRAPADQSLTARVDVPGPSSTERAAWYGAGVAVVLLVAAAGVAARRRNRRAKQPASTRSDRG